MITKSELRKRAKAKLSDAEVLYKNRRYDGAVYIAGYALELSLKARTCRTLNWNEFPETNGEFKRYNSFKTHNLDILLSLSGVEEKIKLNYFMDWNNINEWNPEQRYAEIGNISKSDARARIDSIKNLMSGLK